MSLNDALTSIRGAENLKKELTVIEAARLLCIAGTRRATAADVGDCITANFREGRVELSVVGHVLRSHGVTTRICAGRTHFVLDDEQLTAIQDDLKAGINEAVTKVETILGSHRDIAARIDALRRRWRELAKLTNEARELEQRISESQSHVDRKDSVRIEQGVTRSATVGAVGAGSTAGTGTTKEVDQRFVPLRQIFLGDQFRIFHFYADRNPRLELRSDPFRQVLANVRFDPTTGQIEGHPDPAETDQWLEKIAPQLR